MTHQSHSDAPTVGEFTKLIRAEFGPTRVKYAAQGDNILTGTPYVRDTTDHEAEHRARMALPWRAIERFEPDTQK